MFEGLILQPHHTCPAGDFVWIPAADDLVIAVLLQRAGVLIKALAVALYGQVAPPFPLCFLLH